MHNAIFALGYSIMWIQENTTGGKILHKAISAANTQEGIKLAVLSAADHAFALFDDNIEDDSMYCIFDWNFSEQALTITITDPTKRKAAAHVVQLALENYAEYLTAQDDQQEQMQLWLHNHLTTSAEFLQFSLVAAITADGDVSNSQLL